VTNQEPPRSKPVVPLESRAARAAGGAARRLTSDALFAGTDELVIEHRGCEYRLRRTALGKLILTK